MIFLDVKQYCQDNCYMFEADIEKSELYGDGKIVQCDCVIRCKHRELCERMRQKFSHPNEEDLE